MSRSTVIILAESYGEELQKWGPKCLIPLGEKPWLSQIDDYEPCILDRQLHLAKAPFGGAEIIVTGYEHRMIKDRLSNWTPASCGLRIVRNKEWETNNQCASVALALAKTKASDILIVFGDLVFSKNLFWHLLDCSCIVTDSCKKMGEREVGVTVVDGAATQFSYGLPHKWSQIVRLKGRDLEIFREIVASPKSRQWFLFEGLNAMLNRGGSLSAICNKDIKVIDVDTKKDLTRARNLVRNDK